jgi:hypothetical protein
METIMNLKPEFWQPTPITPQPLLASLRKLVLERSEKRSPKWKFRLAPDLGLQVQAKLTTMLLKFECHAIASQDAGRKRGADPTKRVELRERLVGIFQDHRFDRLRPDMMLSHHCLICGRCLTDPVSQARGIGPECWGSTSPSMPFVLNMIVEDAQSVGDAA